MAKQHCFSSHCKEQRCSGEFKEWGYGKGTDLQRCSRTKLSASICLPLQSFSPPFSALCFQYCHCPDILTLPLCILFSTATLTAAISIWWASEQEKEAEQPCHHYDCFWFSLVSRIGHTHSFTEFLVYFANLFNFPLMSNSCFCNGALCTYLFIYLLHSFC